MKGKIVCLAGAWWLMACASASWAEDVGKEAGAVAQAQARLHMPKLLSAITPQSGEPKENVRMVDGHYVLWGEIFEPGRVVALIEMNRQTSIQEDTPQGLALLWRNSGTWELVQTVDIPIFWKSPSSPQEERQFLPDGLPEKPFWVSRLGPARHAVLVVSTPHSRYRGGHFVLEYQPDAHRLDETAPQFSVDEPDWRNGYVVLTGDSGRKAWWTEELFYQFKDARLQFRGSLRTGSYDAEDQFIHVTFPVVGESKGTKWRFVSTPGDQSRYQVYEGEERETDPSAMGEVRFLSDQSCPDRGPHLFQKLTAIPASIATRESYKDGAIVLVPGASIPDGEVQVKGSAELIRALGPKKRK